MNNIEILKLTRCTLVTAILSICSVTAAAADWTQLVPVADIGFPVESVVAVGDDLVVVGGQESVDSSGVYVYERNGNQRGKVRISANDGASGTFFGSDVATNGNIIVVGGYSFGQQGIPFGGGYVFEKYNGNWNQTTLLDGNEENIFINPDVEIVGNSALVSEPLFNGGYVHVYDKSDTGDWYESAIISGRQAGNQSTSLFGHLLASHENTLVVSSRSSDGRILIHVYQFDGVWSLQTTLSTSYTNSLTVDIDVGDGIIAASDSSSASVTVFRKQSGNNWSESRLSVSGREGNDLFGSAVAIDGDRVLVGAMGDHENAYTAGAMYIFTSNGSGGWTESKWMAGTDYSEFGRDIAVDDNQLVVGGNNVVFVADENSAPAIEMRRLNSGQLSFELQSVMNNVSQWQLQIGYTEGGSEYFSSGVLSASTVLQTVSNLPNDGKSYVHVTLLFRTTDASPWSSARSRFVSAQQVTALDSFRAPSDFSFPEIDEADGLIRSVAVNSNMIAVGRAFDVDVNNVGSITTYQFNGGVSASSQYTKRTPLTGIEDGSYAASIALTESVLAVGLTSQSGSVVLYPTDNLSNQAARIVRASDANAALFESLGRSVALNDDVLVAGSNVGAYIFDGADNYAETRLSGEAFVIASSGDRVVVGYQHDGNSSFIPSSSSPVYVYQKDNGDTWQRTRLAPDGNVSGLFGSAVAIYGDTIIVGDPGVNESDSPAIYVYEYSSGTWLRSRITASDVSIYDRYGYSVAVNDRRIVVGAPGDDDNGITSGAAYVYEKNATGSWAETKWTSDSSGKYFGQDVAMHGDAVVVASHSSVYLLDMPAATGSSDNNIGVDDLTDNSGDTSVDSPMTDTESTTLIPGFVACSVTAIDPDADGWGWENNTTCQIQPNSADQSQVDQNQVDQSESNQTQATSTLPVFASCQLASSDPDGDGWGWENGQSCQAVSVPGDAAGADNLFTFPVCTSLNPDADGDGWGWENGQSCTVSNASAGSISTLRVKGHVFNMYNMTCSEIHHSTRNLTLRVS